LINITELKPPKTADGQKRRKRTSPSENFAIAVAKDGENEGPHDQKKNNFL